MRPNSETPRRNFLAAALAFPAAGLDNGLPARVLGKTGLKVTTLGFGCAWTSDPSVFTRVLDLGVNHFDTAPIYQGGNNEAMVRAGIGGRRKQIVLSTKTEAGSRGEALRQLERSLKELGTDYVDIWYLHGKDSPEGIRDELVEAQEIAKSQGKTRFIGVSTHRLVQTAPAILKTGKMDVVLAAYNFTMNRAVEEAAASLHKAGIGLVNMKALAGGPANARWPGQEALPRAFKQPGVPGASLKWVLQHSVFASALVGMLSRDEVEENIASAVAPFTDADRKLLAARLREIPPLYCRMCGRCDGRCPRGLPVADLLRYLMYAESYGQFPSAREHFQRLPQPVTRVRCAECATCAVDCPNGVMVRERLTLAQEWLG